MNIFLTGQIQIGKSTVLSKTLSLLEYNLKPKFGGFNTFHIKESRDVFIAEYGKNKIIDNTHKIATWKHNCMEPHNEIFNSLGVEFLKRAQTSDYIIMDELGFLEKEADDFKKMVFNCLSNHKYCIGILRKANIAWHEPIYKQKDTKIIEVTLANRQGLPYEIYNILTNNN